MEQDFYKLDEAAELLECTILDLLKWGMTGKIDLCIWYQGQLDRYSIPDNAFKGRPAPEQNEKIDELLPLLKSDIKEFVIPGVSLQNDGLAIAQIMWPGCNRPLFLLGQIDGNPQIITITKNDLFIKNKTGSSD